MVAQIQNPEDWNIKKINEIAPLQRGFDLPTKQLVNGEYPVVYSNGILNYHNKFQVKAPGVVTGRSGTIGKVTYVEQDYWPHNTTLWVTDFKNNDPKFIYYLYSFLKLERFSTGSGVPTLNRNDVHAFEVLIPKNREEQFAIAQALLDMDNLIDSLTKLIEKKENIKQGTMQELLTGKKRLPGFSEEWITESLSQVGGITMGQSPPGKSYTSNCSGIPLINGAAELTEKRILITKYTSAPTRVSKIGDLLFCIRATIGNLQISDDIYCLGRGVAGISVFENHNSPFIAYKLKELFELMKQQSEGGVIKGLRKDELANFKLKLPKDKREQSAVAQVLSAMDSEIEALEQKRDKYKQLKIGMMQQLLTGRIRLKCKNRL